MTSDAAVRTRPARPADAGRIASIYNHGIAERVATFETRERDADDVAEWLEAGGRFPVLVAERGGEVAGFGRIGPYSDREAYRGVGELQVYVDPGHRRAGVGGRLVAAVADEARRQGYWKLIGRLFTTNEPMRALLAGRGYREVGVHLRHGRLDGRWRDVLVVELLLDPG
ncbi:MAG: arsinothricin resistance N-acetyltransferase ArsN1 [Actinomycetota bacterium]|nr:arsinothricin resistance N-acetyltransferase ArsN1 [Actinomycetota bacterium]